MKNESNSQRSTRTDRYAGFIEDDFVDSDDGICVSFWVQGCPFRCPGCHNPQTWDYNGGQKLPPDFKEQILAALNKNGVKRNLSILGGEPMCEQNIELVHTLLSFIKFKLPDTKIYLWTGFTLEELKQRRKDKLYTKEILQMVDVLVDGLFDKSLCNTSLKLRGSSNQHIYRKKNGEFYECSRGGY